MMMTEPISPLETPCDDRPEVAARRRAFVEAAREAFFAYGYGGTTMSSIAAKVGGSKTTLWSYFPSKEELFAAVVDDILENYGESLQFELPIDELVPEVLTRFARTLLATLMSPPMLALHQLVIGEAPRFPDLARLFFERGPARGKAKLASYFLALMEKGALRKGDPLEAVHQFVGLCQAGRYQRAMLGLDGLAYGTRPEREAEAAVETFYRSWGPLAS